MGGPGRRARRRPSRHRDDADGRRPRPDRADQVPRTEGGPSGSRNAPPNALGIRTIMFAVDDIEESSLACTPTVPNESARWPSTRTAICPVTSAAPRASSSHWLSQSAEPYCPGSGSRGRPRMRSAMTLRWTSLVPPAMVRQRVARKPIPSARPGRRGWHPPDRAWPVRAPAPVARARRRAVCAGSRPIPGRSPRASGASSGGSSAGATGPRPEGCPSRSAIGVGNVVAEAAGQSDQRLDADPRRSTRSTCSPARWRG